MDNKDIELYYYIDEPRINSLYAQCSEAGYVTGGTTEKQIGNRVAAGFKVGTGKLLSFLGLIPVDANGSLSHDHMEKISVVTNCTVEEKIPIIINYLEKNGKLIKSIDDVRDIISNTYIIIRADFQTPDLNKTINKSKDFVEFKFEAPIGTIIMGSSLSKYKIGLNHLMIMWGAKKGIAKLKVFGIIEQNSESNYYLKPFFISHA